MLRTIWKALLVLNNSASCRGNFPSGYLGVSLLHRRTTLFGLTSSSQNLSVMRAMAEELAFAARSWSISRGSSGRKAYFCSEQNAARLDSEGSGCFLILIGQSTNNSFNTCSILSLKQQGKHDSCLWITYTLVRVTRFHEAVKSTKQYVNMVVICLT